MRERERERRDCTGKKVSVSVSKASVGLERHNRTLRDRTGGDGAVSHPILLVSSTGWP